MGSNTVWTNNNTYVTSPDRVGRFSQFSNAGPGELPIRQMCLT